ncbi:MAG: adenylate/guanylate cyclase domain-containing protein [Myxococcales bacterium]|nr:adenylate/guanylate cyclase domain-containing protein [Myxococcales bacterium]
MSSARVVQEPTLAERLQRPGGDALDPLRCEFVERALEDAFLEHRGAATIRQLRFICVLGTIGFALILPIDYMTMGASRAFSLDLAAKAFGTLVLGVAFISTYLARSTTRLVNSLWYVPFGPIAALEVAVALLPDKDFGLMSNTAIIMMVVNFLFIPYRYWVRLLAGLTLIVTHAALGFATQANTLAVIESMMLLVLVTMASAFAARQLEFARRRDFGKGLLLSSEKEQVSELLHNVLPAKIVERLNSGEKMIADRFDEASVLFVDIVGFTRLSERATPEDIVRSLNAVFTEIDHLVEKHGVEKIKTIGDAYMVAAGIPTYTPDHVRRLARFALELQEKTRILETVDLGAIAIRTGLHCGPVVAGVIGVRKFAFDLWGDTVNVASRMESHGIPGRIQVTEAAYLALKDEFELEERGPITVKGKGEMMAYFLNGPRR